MFHKSRGVIFTQNKIRRLLQWPVKACKSKYTSNMLDQMMGLHLLTPNRQLQAFYVATWIDKQHQPYEISRCAWKPNKNTLAAGILHGIIISAGGRGGD